MVEHRLQDRWETFVLFDEVREFVEDDNRVLFGEIPESLLPVFPYPRHPRVGFCGCVDELLQLERARFLLRLIDDGVIVLLERLRDERCFPESPPPKDHCEFGIV